ncbi:acyl transferase/acyl hydrolase/lysophospholipase [Aspergillus avenaceus]|uniref:Acyl transferase/acyl hydrolase/lysophospholipase n=1 Tax=Aspergillus avenaceus TaxID=36643 RepID=A0A5N6TTJ1_ASPAV|nr:acyl transferase/acyl hydrolase/lysophospholipase [Aspergillus avenaceus]
MPSYKDELLSDEPSSSPIKLEKDENNENRWLLKHSPEKMIRAQNDKIRTEVWFQTEPLDASFISHIKSIRLKTDSHDQGYVENRLEGNWTWFELSILDKKDAQYPKVKEELTLTWESHRNVMESDNFCHLEGHVFEEQHDLLRFLEEGDIIAVRLCARFQDWRIYAKNGLLIFDMSPHKITREAPKYGGYVAGTKVMERVMVVVNEATQPVQMKDYIPRLPETHLRAGAFAPSERRPLRVLSLDGGGVRGLASLHILKAVMENVQPPRQPHEIFDMIGGTSTGGLIAIMLGRLQMSVDECIKAYNKLMDSVFHGSTIGRYATTGYFYNSNDIEDAIKGIIKDKLQNTDALLLDEHSRCKVFVTATCKHRGNNRAPVILRSYRNNEVIPELPGIKLWEAARATSAAPAYFKPVTVGDYELVDGGLGANNPLGWLWTEVLSVFGATQETKCFLSLGTGIDADREVWTGGVPTLGTVESFASIATNSELTHILFRGLIDAFAPLPETPKYWRLNVNKRIPAWDETKRKWLIRKKTVHHRDNYEPMIELDDTKGARGKLMDMVTAYLAQPNVRATVMACAQALSDSLAERAN